MLTEKPKPTKSTHIIQHNLSEQVYQLIKQMILSGQIKGGEKIPEIEISERLGVSRTPIREALRRLQQLGLIINEPRKFAYVKHLDQTEAADIAEVRLSLEKLIIQLLATSQYSINLSHAQELQQDCIKSTREGDFATSYVIDSHIHLELAKLTGNVHLLDLYERLDTRIHLLRLKQKVPKMGLLTYVQQHETLFKYIKDKKFEMGQVLIEQHIMHDL
ncbi:MAG: GntR family transcriptional regulator [Sphaerochaeta sp.]|nr:GntR family transcriptional regulator [Sphaerochaeta sp.]